MSLIARLLTAVSKRYAFTRDDLRTAFRIGYVSGLSENDTPTVKDIDALFEKKFTRHSQGVRP
jgi:hypothetical protein